MVFLILELLMLVAAEAVETGAVMLTVTLTAAVVTVAVVLEVLHLAQSTVTGMQFQELQV